MIVCWFSIVIKQYLSLNMINISHRCLSSSLQKPLLIHNRTQSCFSGNSVYSGLINIEKSLFVQEWMNYWMNAPMNRHTWPTFWRNNLICIYIRSLQWRTLRQACMGFVQAWIAVNCNGECNRWPALREWKFHSKVSLLPLTYLHTAPYVAHPRPCVSNIHTSSGFPKVPPRARYTWNIFENRTFSARNCIIK